MKNPITFIIALLCIQFMFRQASAQFGCTCLPEGITFTTQEQIDNFQANYPGCTEILGEVNIQGAGITNLYGLNVIASIGGNLRISFGNFQNLAGLENLTALYGSLLLEYQNLSSLTGLEGLLSVAGNVEIIENYSLQDLVGLNNLSYIGGSLKLYRNDSLTSLAGLQGLNIIEGNLELGKAPGCSGIDGNPLLTDFTGLNNLIAVNGNMNVMYNYSILSLAGLDNIASIGGSLTIDGNNSLTSLTGLENLNSIGGELTIRTNSSLSTCDAGWLCDYLAAPTGAVNIYNNATGCNSVIDVAYSCGGIPCLPYGNYYFYSQSDIDNFQAAFPNCTELQGNVSIYGNDITDLSGLDMVTSIGGYLEIGSNYTLTSLTGLEGLTSIGYNFSIIGTGALTELTGLNNLTSIGGGLSISHNYALISLTGLESLTSIGDYLYIRNNSALTSLTGLDNLTYIGGSLSISYNDSLSACNAGWLCDLLANTGGSVYIGYNATGCSSVIDVALSCGGLPCLPNGDYVFFSQADIDNFSQAFPGCNELEGNVYIVGDDITNLNGLNQVTSIGGGLGIGGYYSSNPVLANLTGLENLTSIGGNLNIYDNSALTNLTGLDNIDAGSIYNLTVAYNISLSDCAIESVCNYLASPNGDVWIYGNAPGCNSPEEVEEACLGVGEEEFKVQSSKFKVEVYPNPTSEIMHIEFEIPNPSPVRIQIFNVVGNMVADLSDDILAKGQHRITWNVAYLPAGMYICKVQMGQELVARKIVKQ